jgi:hypothetical protein
MESTQPFIIHGSGYHDDQLSSLLAQWSHRLEVQPINLVFFCCFVGAILHAFLTPFLKRKAHELGAVEMEGLTKTPKASRLRFFPQMLSFLSEIEIIFGLWALPALACMALIYGVDEVRFFLASEDYREAFFIALSLIIATTAPIIKFVERGFFSLARLFGNSPLAWWFVIQIFGALLGAFIKETIAMTLCATLLSPIFL